MSNNAIAFRIVIGWLCLLAFWLWVLQTGGLDSSYGRPRPLAELSGAGMTCLTCLTDTQCEQLCDY